MEDAEHAALVHIGLHERAAESYRRFVTWMRRQNALYRSLFVVGISLRPLAEGDVQEERSVALGVQLRPDNSAYVLFDDIPVLVCDGCGRLEKHETSTEKLYHTCSLCGFYTVLGGPRRLLGLGPYSAGLAMPIAAARALIVEAVGPDHACHVLGNDAWLYNVPERRDSLRQLFAVIGFIDEEDVMEVDNEKVTHSCARTFTCLDALAEGEKCLDGIEAFLAASSLVVGGIQHSKKPPTSAGSRTIGSLKRLAICSAPVVWQAGIRNVASTEKAVTALPKTLTSGSLVQDAIGVYEDLISNPISSVCLGLRKRLTTISVQLQALRSHARVAELNTRTVLTAP